MKNGIRLYSILCALMVSFGVNAQVQLVDQTTGAVTNGLVSQDFENLFNGNDCRIADDFVVPSGETWYIDSIKIYGFYNVTNPDSAGMNITIFENNSGAIGSSVYSNVFQVNLDQDGDGAITAVWNTPLQIDDGDYWMAASARKDYLNDAGVWYWYLDTVGSGYEAKWENPGGSWNVCTAWTNITATSCVAVAYPDVVFRIYGCLGPTKPTINNLPNDTTFCDGDQTSITATTNSLGVNFVWNTGDSTATITATQSGTYVVTAYNPTTLCGATAKMNIDVIPSPVSSVADDTICEGQSRSYISTCNTCLFNWSDGSTSNSISKSNTGWVIVTMTDTSTGCIGIDSGWLQVEPLPSIQFYPDNPAHACEGDTMEVGVTDTYTTYYWDHPGWSSVNDSAALIVTEPGLYYLTVTNSLGCIATDTLEVQYHDPPQPNVTISYTNSWKTRLEADSGYQTYEWSNGDTDPVITTRKTAAFSLTVTDEYGCVGVVSLYVISIPAGIEDEEKGIVKVYPNPATDQLNIESNDFLMGATVNIFDATGRLVLTQTLKSRNQVLDISSVPAGHYSVVIQTDEPILAHPLIIE
jgi:hypothetical protein